MKPVPTTNYYGWPLNIFFLRENALIFTTPATGKTHNGSLCQSRKSRCGYRNMLHCQRSDIVSFLIPIVFIVFVVKLLAELFTATFRAADVQAEGVLDL